MSNGPQGWRRTENRGITYFMPTPADQNRYASLAVAPEEALHDSELVGWFKGRINGDITADVQVIAAGEPQVQRLPWGAYVICATRVSEKSGVRAYTYYVGAQQQDRRRFAVYFANTPERFVQHLPELHLYVVALSGSAGALESAAGPAVHVEEQTKPQAQADPRREPAQPAPAENQPAQPQASAAPGPAGNVVEPLSNGLRLTMTADEVIRKFGPPRSDDRLWGGGIGFDGFGLTFNASGTQIWHFTISRDVKLNSGIGIGSSRPEVEHVFGSSSPAVHGQYELTFRFDDRDRVSEIKVRPASAAFAPYDAAKSAADPSPAQPATGGGMKTADLAGVWYGTATTVGTIKIHPDGSYIHNGSGKGTIASIAGNVITFDGPLKAWGGGRATLTRGNLEFYWKNDDGSTNWFSFAKGK
jgi:hypothetical protein